MKKIYLAISLAVCLASAPLTTYAQAKRLKDAAVTDERNTERKSNSSLMVLQDLYEQPYLSALRPLHGDCKEVC